MQVKIFSYNKFSESIEMFEQQVNDFLAEVGEVSSLSVYENLSNSNIVFQFLYSAHKTKDYELCILAWSDLKTLESVVNNAISGVIESGNNPKFVNIISTSKLHRALAAFVVESSRSDESDERIKEQQQQEEKQNSNLNVRAKRKRKA